MKKPLLALASLGLAIALAGCGGTPVSSSSSADPAATSAPSAETADEPEPAEEATEEEAADPDAPIAFGQTYKYEDGLEVTVTKPAKFKPSQYAAGAEGDGTPMKFQITVKNTGTKAYDPTLFSETVSSGDAEAEAIYDSEKDIGGSPNTKVRAGKTVKWEVAYMVLKPKDITMDVSPGFEYNEATFTNNP